tara:strand:+ start:151 stop:1140 length:990 start_codon:yes stop_codon:yes gene_type:complete
MELAYIYAILLSLNNLQGILNTFMPVFLFILSFFNIRLFNISSRDKINSFKNKIKKNYSSTVDENNKPVGWSIHYNYIAFIYYNLYDNNTNDNTVSILTTLKIKDSLFNNGVITLNIENNESSAEEDNQESEIKKGHIKLYTRAGPYEYITYSSREINMNNFDFKINQKKISTDIINKYKSRNNLTTFISGDISTGKTMLGKLIAKELNANFVDDFNPIEPGDTLEYVYTTINPTKKNPVIFVIDEVDILIEDFHNGNILEHKKIPKLVTNKITWNKLLDRIEHGFYPYMLLLLFSNKSKEYINALDPSYIRVGRIQYSAVLENDKKTN